MPRSGGASTTALTALLVCAIAFGAAAHEIPNDVKITAFFKPAGERAYLLLRVPLAALVEVEYPTRGPGYLDLARADDALRGAIKLYLTDNITVFENDTPLPPRVANFRVSLPSDKSFGSYESALAHVQGPPLPSSMDLYWNQQFIDVLLEYPIQSDRSEFAIQLRVDRFARTVTTTLRFLTPDGATRAFEFHGDPGVIALDPRWHQAALRFVVSGFWHILEGIDHLLFLLCLVLPFRRLRPLVIIVTAFTVGHSISLIAAALGFVPDALWFPPLVETLIAITIVYMALENIVQAAKGTLGESGVEYRWILAFAFGVVHGFGFSFALARIAAILRRPSRPVAVRLQSRRRARPDRRAARADPGAWAAVPVRGPRTPRHHHHIGAGGAHRLALDARTRRSAREIPVPQARRRLHRQRDAWAPGRVDTRGPGVGREQLAQALDCAGRA